LIGENKILSITITFGNGLYKLPYKVHTLYDLFPIYLMVTGGISGLRDIGARKCERENDRLGK